jgi:HK97 gp10 family phage protein
MSAEFDLSDVTKLVADLAAAPARVERVSSAKMTEIASRLRDDARANAPVDTGELRDSIEIHGGKGYRIVRATAPHSFFVEFGTSDTAPQPFMWPAAARAAVAMHEAFAEFVDPLNT